MQRPLRSIAIQFTMFDRNPFIWARHGGPRFLECEFFIAVFFQNFHLLTNTVVLRKDLLTTEGRLDSLKYVLFSLGIFLQKPFLG